MAISKVLVEALITPSPEKRLTFIREIEKLEHVGDEITHQIFQEVSTTFITPFDREDIHSLASALDDIADYMYASAKKINVYKIDPTSDTGMQKTADAILTAVLAVNEAVVELRNLKNTQKIIECVIKINSAENTVWFAQTAPGPRAAKRRRCFWLHAKSAAGQRHCICAAGA